jgi:apolipoprotein N-acyltransferase
MFKKFSQSTPLKNVLALASGALLVFAFAPFYQSYLAIMALALFLWTLIEASPKQAALRGLLFGLGLFGLGVSWVYISIHTYGDAPLPVAGFITGLLVIILALFISLQAYLWRRFFKYNDANTILLAFPVIWVLFEWCRSWMFTGFPWLFIGYSQMPSFLSAFAPLGGVYLISFVIALQASLLVFSCLHRRYAPYCLLGIFIIWGLAWSLETIHWTHPQSTPLKVALIQGNVPQSRKWDPAQTEKTLALYQNTTETLWNNNIIVWPEAAVPLLKHQAETYLEHLDIEAKKHNVALILGIPILDQNHYYNAIIGLGSAMGTYHKRHLVPFGEYLPFSSLFIGILNFFSLPMSDFSAGPDLQKKLNLLGFDVATYLCYEIAYPAEFLTQFPETKLIVTLSDDAWFGDSFAASQHLQIAQMRSLETGRYQLVATDNGITAIINAKGQITAQLPQFEMAVLKGKVFAMDGTTPLIHLGTGGILFILFVLFGLAIAFRPEML